MSDLRVSLVQADLAWQDPESNRKMLAETLSDLKGKSDLIVLPEMFTTGFSMQPEQQAEDYQTSETLKWLKEQATALNSAVTGSMATKIDAGYVNRMLFVTPEGEVNWYDKRHLFRMAGEHHHYESGQERKVFSWKGWRILPMICYDLRFPAFSRNKNDYDLAIYVANWPAPRRQPWRTLLQARAIENQAYVIGVNRVGRDGSGLDYSGDSLVVDFKGDLQIDREPFKAFVDTTVLSLAALKEFKEKFPAWQDADDFELV